MHVMWSEIISHGTSSHVWQRTLIFGFGVNILDFYEFFRKCTKNMSLEFWLIFAEFCIPIIRKND